MNISKKIKLIKSENLNKIRFKKNPYTVTTVNPPLFHMPDRVESISFNGR